MMLRARFALIGVPAVAGLILTASSVLAWPLGGPSYGPPVGPASDYGYNLFDPHPGYYGGGYYREYYAFGRGFGVANFPLPLPNYPPYYPENYPSLFHRFHSEPAPLFAPGATILPEPPADTAVHVEIRVPDGAEVWIDGAATQQTGSERRFVSPPLRPGRTYSYELRARWTDAGKAVEQRQNVEVRAGEHLNVRFPVSEPPPAPKAAALAEGER